MSYKNLKKFVREQAIKGADPEKLREGLILNGWDKKDVEQAITEVYSLKKKIKTGSILIIILIVIILSVSLLLIFSNVDFSDSPTDIEPPIISNGDENGEEKEIEHRCAEVQDISEKEECYYEEIQLGFACEGLSAQETFYCNRVLEIFLLDAFS